VNDQKKNPHVPDTKIVTRMTENSSSGTKTIRSVGEVGTGQYYVDKVDISKDGTGRIVYTSTHDVYNSPLPRSLNPGASAGVGLAVVEDSPGAGTFTGTMEEMQGGSRIVRDVTISRGSLSQLAVKL
jgi:hypothetical protein